MSAQQQKQERVWLITGCSSGFGRELVLEVLSRGDKVIATSRRVEAMADLAQAGAHTLALDVTSPLEDLHQTLAKAVELYGRIDVLINNAGFIFAGSIEELRYYNT